MKTKIKGSGYLILILSILSFYPTLSSDDLTSISYDTDPTENTEIPAGYWQIKEVNVLQKKTDWMGAEGDVKYAKSWQDNLQIKHTINCMIKWSRLPEILKSLEEVKFTAEFVNYEFSTISNIQTGIRLSIDNGKPLKLLDLKKTMNNHTSEIRSAKVIAPKYNDSRYFRILVECYSGQSLYTVEYIYSWINN